MRGFGGISLTVGGDFSHKNCRFTNALKNVEQHVNNYRNPLPEFECKKDKRTVTKINYRPSPTVIILIL